MFQKKKRFVRIIELGSVLSTRDSLTTEQDDDDKGDDVCASRKIEQQCVRAP